MSNSNTRIKQRQHKRAAKVSQLVGSILSAYVPTVGVSTREVQHVHFTEV